MSVTARHYASGKTVKVAFDRGKIVSIRPSGELATRWIAPAFFDPQINGALGIGFNSPALTTDGIGTVYRKCHEHGIGGFLPTVITDSFEAIRRAFEILSQALKEEKALAEAIPGFHLEGPYINGDDGPRGAHPKAHARDPDWEEFQRWQEAAAGLIRMVTLAPERAGAIPFIEKLTKTGVVVAIGHTSASNEILSEAVKAGAKTSTHLGNGCSAMLPRHDNVIWNQLGNDELWASIIPDGHHLPANVVKGIIRAKTIDRILLTCDAGSLAGLPPGRYTDWGSELEVLAGGKIVVPGTPYLAGSGVFTDTCVSNVIRMAGVSLSEGVAMASRRPRELLGLPWGELEEGAEGEWITFDWEPAGELRRIEFV